MPAAADPKVIAYDLEFARPLPNNDWRRQTECGVGVLCSWSNQEVEPRVWIPSEGANVWKQFAHHVLQHEVFLTWNGLGCDDPLIYAQFPLWEECLGHGKRLDLSAVLGLYALAEKKGLGLDYLTGVLSRGVPNNYPELVGYKPTAKVNVRSGWSLESTYCATFGRESAKSMPGEEAPIRWQAGQRGQVIGYCVGDVKRILDLWERAWGGGEVKNRKGQQVVIPRPVLDMWRSP
ncbi:hypothetical protein CMI37_19090 [Candidatus Pacearchaeota archaeon]|nr:hypothetical protein [Candidatus Pacearchaeota archaeon]